MSQVEVVIVDDEPVAVRRLVALLRGVAGVRIAGTAPDGHSALALITDTKPDLALLDIEMPGLDGIGLAHRLRALPEAPAIVFTTAFSRFAVEAFDLQAAHYLLKPVDASQLALAVQRVRIQRDQRLAAGRAAELEEVVRKLRALEHSAKPEEDALWLPDGAAHVKVLAGDITWVEAERDYVRIHTARRSYFVRGRLGELETRLATAGFVRVHRSAIVRAGAVIRVEASGERAYRLVLVDGTTVEASRRFGARVRALTAA